MEHMAPKAFPSARVATIGVAGFVLIVSLGIQARPSAQQPAPQAKSAQSSSPIGAVSPASSHRRDARSLLRHLPQPEDSRQLA